MTLNEIITDLQYGELSSHGMFATALTEENKSKIIANINVALTDLYTRFPLLTRELTLKQIEGITTYPLIRGNAVSSGNSLGFIMDSPMYPFLGDVIQIQEVYDEYGNTIHLNTINACIGVATPAPDVLQVASPLEGEVLFVIYQAKHPEVTLSTVDLLLPAQFKSALLAYVASRVYAGGTSVEHSTISNTLYSKYELFCTQLRMYGVDNSDYSLANPKPMLGGWV